MFEIIKSTMPFLTHGLWITFQISLITIVIGSFLGFLLAWYVRKRFHYYPLFWVDILICYPVLRLAKLAGDKMGRVEIEH